MNVNDMTKDEILEWEINSVIGALENVFNQLIQKDKLSSDEMERIEDVIIILVNKFTGGLK